MHFNFKLFRDFRNLTSIQPLSLHWFQQDLQRACNSMFVGAGLHSMASATSVRIPATYWGSPTRPPENVHCAFVVHQGQHRKIVHYFPQTPPGDPQADPNPPFQSVHKRGDGTKTLSSCNALLHIEASKNLERPCRVLRGQEPRRAIYAQKNGYLPERE